MKIQPVVITEDLESEVINYEKFIVSNDIINKDVKDFLSGKIAHGYELGFHCIDKYFVCKKFEFYGLVGKKGRGKTTINLILFLCHSIANGLKFALALQENSEWSIKLNLINYLLGEYANNVEKDNPELYRKASKFIEEHFIFLDVESIKEALDTTEYMINEKGIDIHGVFLDPINSFDSGYYNSGNSHQDMVDTSKKILRHSKKVCSAYVSQHPIMSAQRQEEDVNSYSAEGGAVLNKASFTYAINRNSGESTNRLSVDNVRNLHTGGEQTKNDDPVEIYWSPTKISLGSTSQGVIENDIIGTLKRIHNPLNEDLHEKEKEELPVMNVNDAFGNNDNDVPF